MEFLVLFAETNPWTFRPYPGVWFLVLGVGWLGWWVCRIGRRVLPDGSKPVSVVQKRFFWLALVLLYLVADWPMHSIAEEHLYSVHMFQHLVITLIVPPLFLLALPEWLASIVILEGQLSSRVIQRLSHPVVAGVIFNFLVALSHWSGFVRLSVENGAFHYVAHLVLFISALLMWLPVVSPIREHRLSPPGQMLYLFLISVIPTVPAGWLTFAEGTVYNIYDDGVEPWGIGVIADQQAAGAVMKILGGFYLWGIIVVKYFRFAGAERSRRLTRL